MKQGDAVLVGRRPSEWWKIRPVWDSGYSVSRAIQRFTSHWSNHVAGVLEIHDRLVLVEADWDAVKIRPLDYYLDDPEWRVLHVPCPVESDELRARIGRFWAHAIFDNYDKALIVKMARAIRRGGLAELASLRRVVGDKFWICSELVQDGWSEADVVVAGAEGRIAVPADFENGGVR